MESRASLRQNVFSTIYLPIVYVIFGTILGEPFPSGLQPARSFTQTNNFPSKNVMLSPNLYSTGVVLNFTVG